MAIFTEPKTKRAIAFFDGQNLYHGAREAFGHSWPQYDPMKLAHAVCEREGWELRAAQFYTGKPSVAEDPRWANWWQKKLLAISRTGCKVITRDIRYRDREIDIGDGCTLTRRIGEEKGIDVRIAVDVIRRTNDQDMEVALIFSQDQDLAEAAQEAKRIAESQKRWITVASAYPQGGTYRNKRGINATDWKPFDQAFYEACCDTTDYR